MVDDKINRYLRVDALGISTELGDRIAHGGEVNHGWNAGEVLHQHAGWTVGNFAGGGAGFQPALHSLDVVCGYRATVFEAEQIFQQNFERERQAGNAVEAVLLGFLQVIINI